MAVRLPKYSIKPAIKPTGLVWFVYIMWFVILCDPQWMLAKYTVGAVTRAPTILFAIMLLMIPFKQPRSWFPPLGTFVLYTLAIIPFAYNRGYAIGVAKFLIAFWVLALASLSFLRNVKMSVPIIAAHMMYSYLWWIGLGVYHGRVSWHPDLANFDAYGPLMSIGLGMCYYFGVATNSKKEKRLAYLAAMGCVVGLVSAYARGAVLAGAAVILWIWMRSRHKLATTVAVAVGMVGITIAGFLFSGSGRSETGANFFSEMATVASSDDATRDDRKVLWALARREFADHPFVGVGANNFGPYAAQRFRAGDTGGGYDDNPATLYDRQLHSTFFQLLCEYGLIGSSIFVWMLVDFWRRNKDLRKKAFVRTWAEKSGGRLDLVSLSYGLECGLIGFLSSGLFYNQIFNIHWLYSILIINTLLWYHARPAPAPRAAPAPNPAPAPAPA